MTELCATCGFTIRRDRDRYDPGMPGHTFSHLLPSYERSILWRVAHAGDGIYTPAPDPNHTAEPRDVSRETSDAPSGSS